ncbi:MAG: hypothetical protein QG641_802 [Candidatus Poribacteria bacterium]|nr:hypothetical protein [Candidatus Poribacteria bacterium]
MWLNKRILLSNVTASLLVVSYPMAVMGAELGALSGDGTTDITVDTNDTITLSDGSPIAIGITDTVLSGITVSNSGVITINAENNDVAGVYIDNGNEGAINNVGAIDLNTTGGAAYGIYINEENDGNNGTITNSGSIRAESSSSDASGIYTGYNGLGGNITNTSSGTITVISNMEGSSAGGIVISDTNDGEINNIGSINATSTVVSAYGISVGTNETDAILNNEGDIIAEGRSDTFGIYTGSNNGTISHSGTIEASTTTEEGTAYGIYMSDNYGTVTTDGSIDAHSLNGSTYGIYSENDNGGVINANNSIISTSTNGDASGIYIGGNNQNLTNNGSIEAHSDNSRATGIEISNTNDGTVANINSITAESITGDAYGLAVSSNNGTISNSGTIESISTEGNAYGIYVSMTNAMDGLISNSGTIIANSIDNDAYGIYVNDNMGTVTNSGTITAPIALYLTNSGTVENTSSGVINGDIQAGMSNFQNNGTINLHSTDTSTVNNFTQSATGVLGIKLNSGADGIPTYSKLSAGDTVILNAGTTINVNVQTATYYQDLLIGQQLTDVISATTLTVDVSTLNVTDTSALLNFTAVIDGTTLDLDVIKGVSILDATQNSGVVGAYGAASVLEEYEGDDSDLNNFISSLNTLETEEEVAQAILETTPTTTAALSNMSTQFYNSMSSIVQSHQNNPRGMNSGDMVLGDKNLWVKPFGSYSKQNNKDGLNGFSAHSKGVGIGLDGEYENNQRIGLAVFYTQADADTNGVSQNTKLDILNLIAYGNFPIIDNETNLFYQLGMGIQQTSSTRTITAPALTAKADFNAKTLFANIKLARDMALNNSLNLSNQLFGTYVYYKNPSYSESGAGGLNLNVQGFNTTSLVFGVEESLKYSMIEGTNLILNVALGYDFGDTNQNVLASYHGASGTTFTTNGIDNGPWTYKTGVEIAQELQDNLSVNVGYDLDGKGSDFKNHSVSAKVNWKF